MTSDTACKACSGNGWIATEDGLTWKLRAMRSQMNGTKTTIVPCDSCGGTGRSPAAPAIRCETYDELGY